MAGLMSRASVVVKAKFSKLLDHAENPAETLDYSYERQLELLQNVKRGIADVVTAKKRLELQETQLQQSVVKLDAQARQALAAGREDLARRWSSRRSSRSCSTTPRIRRKRWTTRTSGSSSCSRTSSAGSPTW